MLKRTVARLLLFGIPFGLSYWATRPAPARIQNLVVCAYPGDRPGELRISLERAGCSENIGQKIEVAPVSISPAVTTGDMSHPATGKPLNLPF